jgi:hypothetical protein
VIHDSVATSAALLRLQTAGIGNILFRLTGFENRMKQLEFLTQSITWCGFVSAE